MPKGHANVIVKQENEMDISKVFNAIAKIIGDREHVKIHVVSIEKKKTEEETA